MDFYKLFKVAEDYLKKYNATIFHKPYARKMFAEFVYGDTNFTIGYEYNIANLRQMCIDVRHECNDDNRPLPAEIIHANNN